jgi:membrane fusion protein
MEQMSRLQGLERSRLELQHDRLAAQGDVDAVPLKADRDRASVERDITMVEEQIVELAARREIVIPATTSGVVTSLQAKRGGHADPTIPLLGIVPDGSTLQAQLFCSSRAVGFLRVGQRVLLRYEAFPYQKFGHYAGSVISVAQAAVNPTELGPHAPVAKSDSPVYLVTIKISDQSIRAYGKPIPLQPGMQLEADVVLENRRLVEWMLEPLFTITGSWKR